MAEKIQRSGQKQVNKNRIFLKLQTRILDIAVVDAMQMQQEM